MLTRSAAKRLNAGRRNPVKKEGGVIIAGNGSGLNEISNGENELLRGKRKTVAMEGKEVDPKGFERDRKKTSLQIQRDLHEAGDAKKAKVLVRFFKCGKGDYGEGDEFLGVQVPDVRRIVKENCGGECRFFCDYDLSGVDESNQRPKKKQRKDLSKWTQPFEDYEHYRETIFDLMLSEFHEVRLAGIISMAEEAENLFKMIQFLVGKRNKFKQNGEEEEEKSAAGSDLQKLIDKYVLRYEKLFRFYCELTQLRKEKPKDPSFKEAQFVINNWDLVDLSAPRVFGGFLYCQENYLTNTDNNNQQKSHLNTSESQIHFDLFARDGTNLWRRRIAVVGSLKYVQMGDTRQIYRLARGYLEGKKGASGVGEEEEDHDLMHKACGWILREAGKRDQGELVGFLRGYGAVMPRVQLRYAVERLPGGVRGELMALGKGIKRRKKGIKKEK
eukprot:Nk52_evm2s361 gene=Nk52_evmTU2s361